MWTVVLTYGRGLLALLMLLRIDQHRLNNCNYMIGGLHHRLRAHLDLPAGSGAASLNKQAVQQMARPGAVGRTATRWLSSMQPHQPATQYQVVRIALKTCK